MGRLILLLLLFTFLYYFLKLLFQIILPLINNSGKRNIFNQNYSKHNKKEGDVTIDYMPKKEKKYNKKDGKYIDYKEIKWRL